MHRVVIALTTLLVLAGAVAVAFYVFVLGAATDRALALAPANTVAYANVYLQPSTSQQMKLSALIGRLPGFGDAASLDDKIDQIAQNLLSSAAIDYRQQIKPWLGEQLAVAALPPGEGGTDPAVVVLVGVSDQQAAETALASFAAETGSGEPQAEDYEGVTIMASGPTRWAFVDELLVLGDAPGAIESVIDVSGGAPSLSDSATYRDATEDLPDDYLASMYLDIAGLGETAGAEAQLSGWSAASAILVAEEEGLRLSGTAPFSGEGVATTSQPASLVEWMPAETRAEAVIFGMRGLLEEAEAAAAGTEEGQPLTDALAAARALAAFGLGIDLDADLLPLLDGEVAVAIGELGADLPRGQLLLRPPDAAGAEEALGRITDGLRGFGASVETETATDGTEVTVLAIPEVGELAYAIADGVVIVGTGSADVVAAIDAHESGGSLADSDAYRATFALAGERAGNEVYVDIGAIVEATGAADELAADARDILQQVGSLGLTASSQPDRVDFRLVVTIE